MANYRNTARTDYEYRNAARAEYQYGNAARDYGYQERKTQEYERSPRKKTRTGSSFSILGFAIAGAAFVIFAITMVNYVHLQSELTRRVKSVASSQIVLNDLKSKNDERLKQISGSVDLEHIESVAREELGMRYATEGQVITYTSAGNDYMRRADGN